MKLNRFTSIGVVAIAAAVVMMGMAYATSGVIHAQSVPCDATPTEEISSIQGGNDFQAAQIAPACTATSTQSATVTQGPFKTYTPTSSPTPAPSTNTPVPAPTQPPATNTPVPPAAGNEGVAVKPPNTGSGGGSGGGSAMPIWLLAAGLALAGIGGSAVFAGMRRR